jgi:hypothetical protein
MQTQQRYYTPEEYLALEEIAEFRSEYRDRARSSKFYLNQLKTTIEPINFVTIALFPNCKNMY